MERIPTALAWIWGFNYYNISHCVCYFARHGQTGRSAQHSSACIPPFERVTVNSCQRYAVQNAFGCINFVRCQFEHFCTQRIYQRQRTFGCCYVNNKHCIAVHRTPKDKGVVGYYRDRIVYRIPFVFRASFSGYCIAILTFAVNAILTGDNRFFKFKPHRIAYFTVGSYRYLIEITHLAFDPFLGANHNWVAAGDGILTIIK